MRWNRGRWQWLPAALLLLTAWGIGCGPGGSRAPAADTAPKKEYINHGPDAQYVGREACKSCHSDKFETFVHSEMGRSWKPAKASLSAAQWDGQRPIHDPHLDFYYLPFRKGEDLFIREYRLRGRDTVHNRTERISYIVGSGQHTNSHIIADNGYLHQAPLTWYAQDGKWDLPPGFEGGHNSRFGRTIELECVTCHNAMPQYEPGSDNKFVSVPDGIDCERCHGPGSLHVQEQQSRSKAHLIDGIDYSIVHPGKLPIERQFDICQRCHLQGTAVPVAGKSFQDFRPGMVLSDYINIFIPRYEDSLHNFIMASHPDRLRMSACFRGSQANAAYPKAMTCISCHNPHVSIEAMGPDHYRESCLGCHTAQRDNLCTAPQAQRDARKDDCAGCHMPRSGSSDIPHVRITDHFIRKPDAAKALSPAESQAQQAFFRLVCRTQESPGPALMAEGYLTQYEQFTGQPWLLDSADRLLSKALKAQGEAALLQPLVRLRFLQQDYASLVILGQRHAPATVADAWTAYRIGEGFQGSGKLPEAISWYSRANALAPAHLRFKHKLAAAHIQQQAPEQALTLLNELVGAYAKDPAVFNDRGFAYVLTGDMLRAERDFLSALRLDPDSETAMANLASLYLNVGRIDDARRYTAALLARDGDNPQYLRLKDAVGM